MTTKMTVKELLRKEKPEKWPGKWHTKEELPDFVRRVYDKYFPMGLMQADIFHYDRKLWIAIQNYRKNNLSWPDDLKLTTQREILADKMRLFKAGKRELLTPDDLVAIGRKLLREEAKTQNNLG